MAKIKIDNLKFEKLDLKTYTNVGVIITQKLHSKMKLNSSLIDGFVSVFKENNPLLEIEDENVDVAENIGKYCVGSDGKLILIIDKTTIDTIEKAKKDLTSYFAVVELENIEYEQDMYDVTMINEGTNEGCFNTIILNGEEMLNYIKNNMETIDLTEMNPVHFVIKPKFK